MLGVLTDNSHYTSAADNFTVITDALDRSSHLHDIILLFITIGYSPAGQVVR